MTEPNVTIVLASIDSSMTIEASLRGFADELAGRGQILVVDASRDGIAAASLGNVKVLNRPSGTLAPVLWRDGLRESTTEFVAFSTAQMVPRRGWFSELMRTIQWSGSAGVGGPIAAGFGLSLLDRAMYLLRYANYLPPVPESIAFEPPGDNAIYRRCDLDTVANSWRNGFWEIEVHKQLRLLGHKTAISQQAIVDFTGGYRLGPAISHRMAHARNFGAGRVRDSNLLSKLARTVMAPAVPPMLLSRIIRNLQSRGEPIGPWIPSFPYLSVLLATWSAGEATGALFGSGNAA